MNAYIVDGEEYDDILDGAGRDVELVFAETAGQAKAVRVRAYGLIPDVDFLDLRAYLLARDVPRETGIAKASDPLWSMDCPRFEAKLRREGQAVQP